jgi:hypothetical protein
MSKYFPEEIFTWNQNIKRAAKVRTTITTNTIFPISAEQLETD